MGQADDDRVDRSTLIDDLIDDLLIDDLIDGLGSKKDQACERMFSSRMAESAVSGRNF